MNAEQRYLAEWFPEEDENDFLVNVRIYSLWNEDQFIRMIDAATQLLDELSSYSTVAEHWDKSFANTINILTNLLQHPGFLAENDLGMTKEQYKSFIFERINKLDELKERYWNIKYKEN